ncbi:MAG: ribosome silencing factor [Bacillota bacterium]|jgi:ribosome-associated protein|nr:ribosome silencing factor [Eubacteriales bacterium]MDI9492404.1 ribosome silencing factor [Bacillota bacterium]NLV70209.1 ribosome silencing factor [Clostridiales bacterium]HRV33495.1 ribosome silencing factor [Anaerovoracaceae bacterium]MDD3537552.1 ribosome silencing factor [Eubacteriales bacterium]
MNNKEIALFIADTLNAKKARDIVILDIGETSGFADYFVIATAASQRQLKALSEEVEERLSPKDIPVRHIEGKGSSGWILMDYGDVIVNIFTEEQRQHYQIEKIWNDCLAVDHPFNDLA